MATINENYLKLKAGYLFPEIGRRVKSYADKNPLQKIIRLGIGDVTQPLAPAIVEAMVKATQEMGISQGFRGYGPEQGYDFLLQAILDHDYKNRGVQLSTEEIFVSDGSKCDCGNIQEIFSLENKIAVVDPVYPVYVDTNVMAGRSGAPDESGRYSGFIYMPAEESNGFEPDFPKETPDLIYLCYPNNPTGTVATKERLAEWVLYASKIGALVLYDSAYESFIQNPSIPKSIYEIPGAKEVAMEFRSFSKTAGFTGIRCAYLVIPKELKGKTKSGEAISLNQLWNRRHTTKFNGVSYVTQRGAEAVFSKEGKPQIAQQIQYYMENAALIRDGLKKQGYTVYGGENAPYIWLKTPKGSSSWEFFDELLHKVQVVGTPGSGFGPAGEGFFRLSAFGKREDVQEAILRIQKI